MFENFKMKRTRFNDQDKNGDERVIGNILCAVLVLYRVQSQIQQTQSSHASSWEGYRANGTVWLL